MDKPSDQSDSTGEDEKSNEIAIQNMLDSRLFTAIRKKQNEEKIKEDIEKCLADGADINAQNNRNKTILHIAIEKGFEDVIEFLLNQPRIKTDIPDNNDETAQTLASNKSNPKVMNLFGSNKTNINNTSNINAQVRELIEELKLQLPIPDGKIILSERNFKKLKKLDNEGNIMMLKQATEDQNTDLIKFLVRCGVDINYRSKTTKQRVVDIAWENEKYDSMLMLLKLDSYFPERFCLNDDDDDIPSEIKNFVKERNELHKWIKNKDFGKTENFVTKNHSSKFFNSVNESALEVAAKFGSSAILEYLLGFLLPLFSEKKHLDEEDKLELLKEFQKENDNTLLITAAQFSNKENVEYLIKYTEDINFKNKFGKKAVDLAWGNEHYDTVLVLLKADSDFPSDFTLNILNGNDINQNELKEFVNNRDELHRQIEQGDLEKVKELAFNNQTKFCLNRDGKSALLTAVEKIEQLIKTNAAIENQCKIYGFLKGSVGIEFRNKFEKQSISNLPENARDSLKKALIVHFPTLDNAHIYSIVLKSRSKKKFEGFKEKIEKLYEHLGSIKEISKILEVVHYADYLDIVFDFEDDSIKDINPTESEATKGTTDYKDGRIYIAAKIEEKPLLGTLAHELTHLAMYMMYGNNCNPFNVCNQEKTQEFKRIASNIKDDIRIEEVLKERENKDNVKNEPIVTLARAFRYPAEEQQSELIVRIPHILAQYNEDGRKWLNENEPFKLLFNYFNDQNVGGLMHRCQEFIDNHFLIKPRKEIQLLNQSLGEISSIMGRNIDFTQPIDLTNFLESPHQVLLLRTECPLLSISNIFQSLIKKGYSIQDTFFINSNSYVKNHDDINKAFYSAAGKILCIEQSSSLDQNKLLYKKFQTLNELLRQKKDKKVILLIKESIIKKYKALFNNKYVVISDRKFTLSDFSVASQEKLLKKEVKFQGKMTSLNKIIQKNDVKIKSLINSEILVQLLKLNAEIEIGRKPLGMSDLKDSYVKMMEEINLETLVHKLLSPISNDKYIISGINSRLRHGDKITKLFKCLKINYMQKLDIKKQIETFNLCKRVNNRIIIVDDEFTEDNFKKLCCDNFDKFIYWINVKKTNKNSFKFVLQQFYNPDFYFERQFKKVYVKNSIKNEFKENILLQVCLEKKLVNMVLVNMRNLCDEQNIKILQRYLKEAKHNCVIMVDNSKREELKFFTDINDEVKTFLMRLGPDIEILKIMLKNIEYNPKDKFKKLSKYSKSVHWLKIEDWNGNENLVWHDSYGSLSLIRQHREKHYTDVYQYDDFLQKVMDNNALILTDESGMGKTTTATKLSEKKMQSHWVIRINLKDCPNAIKNLDETITIKKAVNFLLESETINSNSDGLALTKLLLEYKLENGKNDIWPLLLLLDGFDEISNDSKKSKRKVSLLLKFLRNKAIVWITARKHETKLLENSLSIFATEFKEIERDNQFELLKRFWMPRFSLVLSKSEWDETFHSKDPSKSVESKSAKENKYELYFNSLFKEMDKVINNKNAHFMGVPLMLRLLAEAFQNKFKDFIQAKSDDAAEFDNLDVFKIYQHFINEKYNIYFKEKTELLNSFNLTIESSLKEIFVKKHWRLAFSELFPNKANMFLGIKSQFLDENNALKIDGKELEEISRVGLIQYTQGDSFEFTHRSFAEYFVADMLNSWIRKEGGRHPKYPSTEHFLFTEILIESDYKVIRLFLNGHLTKPIGALKLHSQRVITLWLEEQKQFFNEEYETALHISIQEKNEQIFDLILNVFNTDTTTFLPFLVDRNMYQESALYIAAKNKYNNFVKKFLDSVKDCERNVQKELILATIFRRADDNRDPNIKYLLQYISINKYLIIREICDEVMEKRNLIDKFLILGKEKHISVKKIGKMLKNIRDNSLKNYLMLACDQSGNTILHITYRLGHHDIIKWFIEHGANVNSINNDGCTVLHHASSSGDLETVKLLVNNSAKINMVNSAGDSILHHAIPQGDIALIKWLIDHGANINTSNNNGDTVLDIAIKHRRWTIAELLVERNVDICQNDRLVIGNLINNEQWNLVRLVVEQNMDFYTKDSEGDTILLQVLKKLVRRDSYNIVWMPINNLYYNKGQWKLIKWLIDIEESINAQDISGNTALHIAGFKHHLELVKLMIEKKNADVNALNLDGNTILHIMSSFGQFELVKWLVTHRADINIRNKNDDNCLDLAVKNNHWKMVYWLTKNGANTDKILYNASFSRLIDYKFLNNLIKSKRVNVNTTIDSNNNTALHKVVLSGNVTLVKWMLKSNADVNAKNLDGDTALSLLEKLISQQRCKTTISHSICDAMISFLELFYNNPRPWSIPEFQYSPTISNLEEIRVQLLSSQLEYSCQDVV